MNIIQSIFSKNTATNDGGAVYGHANNIGESAFTENMAESGGALYIRSNNIIITDSEFAMNTANKDGGEIDHDSGILSMEKCRLFENIANNGGALYSDANPHLWCDEKSLFIKESRSLYKIYFDMSSLFINLKSKINLKLF